MTRRSITGEKERTRKPGQTYRYLLSERWQLRMFSFWLFMTSYDALSYLMKHTGVSSASENLSSSKALVLE